MINTTKINTRLKKILDYYSLSASAFAEIISVQRSSISHILSGRNKPSLEFITKVLNAFPDIDLVWLLSGVGEFPKNTTAPSPKTEPFSILSDPISPISNKNDSIERIVIFYQNGSFKNYSMNPSK
jgi:transcriptional regulator with XRE-family HTH domain